MKTLSLLPNPDVMFPDLEANSAGAQRFIGCRWDPETKTFAPHNEPTIKPARKEYLEGLQKGELLPGDSATASLVAASR